PARSGQEADGAAGRESGRPRRRARPPLAQPPARRRQTSAGASRRWRLETPGGQGAHRTPRRIPRRVLLVVGLYLLLAYLVLPASWRNDEHPPAMATMPKVTRAPNGLPGDPLNVALVGTEAQVVRAFAAAGVLGSSST